MLLLGFLGLETSVDDSDAGFVDFVPRFTTAFTLHDVEGDGATVEDLVLLCFMGGCLGKEGPKIVHEP